MDDELQLGYAGDDESVADAACEPSDEVAYAEDRPLPCEFITGRAGTGKTFSLVAECERTPTFGQLTATTGISSVNLGAITLHSTLRYSDTASLRDAFISGRLARVLHGIGLTRRRLLVDEASMLDGEQLDLIVRGAIEANRYKDMREPLGITLVGDFAQLPPVRAKWCFEADAWPRFAERTTRLERVWRQDTGAFLDALNFARVGDGLSAADILTQAAGESMWHTALNPEYDGTTILPKNVQVDRYNMMALDRVTGVRVAVTSRRWGKLSRSWDNIPERLELKVGAYVMVLANAPDFSVVNGDCGHVVAHVPATREDDEHFIVHLVRTDHEVDVYRLVRGVEQADRPDGWSGETIHRTLDAGEYIPRAHYRGKVKRYVLGQVEYFPLRLAYASTVHKSQGLTLDRAQIDIRDHFFASPAMCYVALSRCRTLVGLRIVGQRERFVKNCNVDPRVRPWI